ncbi:hypothetical protein OH492_14290 [Vibrio chagasii]|nr:hypothetical protein [Vibrio chagasii]
MKPWVPRQSISRCVEFSRVESNKPCCLIKRTGQVIAIGHSDEIFIYRGMLASGASDYLVPPVTPQDLEYRFFAALQKQQRKTK